MFCSGYDASSRADAPNVHTSRQAKKEPAHIHLFFFLNYLVGLKSYTPEKKKKIKRALRVYRIAVVL